MDVIAEIKKLLEEYKNSVIQSVTVDKEKILNAIEAQELRIKDIEGKMQSRKVSLPGLEDEKTPFSFFKACHAIRTNDWSQAGFENEVFQETRKKAMSMGTSSAGGYIVPTIYIAELIELLQAESVVISMGATVLNNLQGSPVQIPRQSGGATAYWVGENVAITSSDLTLEQVSMTPKKVGCLVKLSNTLLKLSNPSAEALIRRDIAVALALKIDLASLRGLGASYQPKGVNLQTGLGTVAIGTNGGNITFDHLIDMEYELAADNALRGKLGYIFHPCIRRNLLKRKVDHYTGQSTNQSYLIAPVTEQVFQNWLGYPYKMTTQIPINLTKAEGTALTEVYFGNWQELIVGQWGGMELMASQETSDAFEKDQTWVRVLQEVDIAVRHGESFCLINDAKSSES
jgi:HK97 family phage major capsid protein